MLRYISNQYLMPSIVTRKNEYVYVFYIIHLYGGYTDIPNVPLKHKKVSIFCIERII